MPIIAAGAPPTMSLWEETRTFFPLFMEELNLAGARSATIVGASDGKFVLPLARRGLDITAIELDHLALDGGAVTLPGGVPGRMEGLRARLNTENLSSKVQILQADVLNLSGEAVEPADAVWTSCSWHYRVNHRRPLGDFIDAIQQLCTPGGVLGAEYMMPVDAAHTRKQHYPEAGEVRRYFPSWNILWETYTPPFLEAPHVEQLHEHVHRMGLLIASRPSTTGA